MTGNLRALALAAAFTTVASMASALSVTAFATPLTAGDSTNGAADADDGESFGMTSLSFAANGPLRAQVSITINPFGTDLSGNPTNSIGIGYSINGGLVTPLPIVPVLAIGASGLGPIDLADGDVLAFFVTGTAGQSGNQVTFAVETSAQVIPVLPAAALGLTGIGALVAARRGKKSA